MNEDGCMILMKIFCRLIIEFHKNIKIQSIWDALSFLPANVAHAVGFSFGRDGVDLGYPKHITKSTNHWLHIHFCYNNDSVTHVRKIEE